MHFKHWCKRLLIAIGKQCLGKNEETSDPVRKVLIYSPNTGGHRHQHIWRIVDVLSRYDIEIYLFTLGLEVHGGQTKWYRPHESFYLKDALKTPRVHSLTVGAIDQMYTDELTFIRSMQDSCKADATMFVDGDRLKWVFSRQLLPWKPALRGRNYATFLLSEYVYRSDVVLYGAVASRHWFFHQVLCRNFPLLDVAFHTDENAVQSSQSNRFIHLPDFLIPPQRLHESDAGGQIYSVQQKAIEEFLKRNKGKTVLVCFGELEPRKGFDQLLRLATLESDTVLIRVGRTKPEYSPIWDEIINLETLYHQDRFFEFNTFIRSEKFVEFLLDLPDFFVLPYQNFYRTSGFMLDVLFRGKPVVVPDTGLFKTRIEDNGVGLTFSKDSFESLHKAFRQMKETWRTFIPAVRVYAKTFGQERFSQTIGLIAGSSPPPDLYGDRFERGRQMAPRLPWSSGFGLLTKFILKPSLEVRIIKKIRKKWVKLLFAGVEKGKVHILGRGDFLKWFANIIETCPAMPINGVYTIDATRIEFLKISSMFLTDINADHDDTIICITDTEHQLFGSLLKKQGTKGTIEHIYDKTDPMEMR